MASAAPQSRPPAFALTSSDLADPSAADAHENHGRSQALLQELLRHHGLQRGASLAVPFVHEEADAQERRRLELTSRLRVRRLANVHCLSEGAEVRLRERGIHGMHTFRAMLHSTDVRRDGTCPCRTLEGALANLGIRFSASEFSQLVGSFGVGGDDVDYARLLAYGCSNWSLQREEAVREAFESLAEACPGGRLHVSAIERRFRPEALTPELVPGLVEHHSAREFLARWGSGVLEADGQVSWLHFADYYLDVSLYFDSDQDFCHYVCKSWGIDTDDWLAKKVFRRFAGDYGSGGGVLPASEFIRMLDQLDPTISEEEALAFYQAIDEDSSGEVSLQEFLDSKVLRVKRLFDEFDTQAKRTATRDELLQMFRRLNSTIRNDEALALYQYADLDGNGEVSFAEFLENNLLKLLQIFGEFSKARNRCFSEAEVKALLRREDPSLDDFHVHQIYRAIDTDSSGSISFVEFCESHILRAKALFDRYDVDGSHCLTRLKFRELLAEMDGSLTGSQMEALYQLVADHGSGKVLLAGFLNPNVVRIKLLFDKHDRSRSGYLDAKGFRAMLRDTFSGAADRDIDALLAAVMPPGHEAGITFCSYVQRFREISHKHDVMQLAKRREARARALAKGLSPVP